MDWFDVTANYSGIDAAFSRITAKTTVISVQSDILFTPQQQQELYEALRMGDADCRYVKHCSQYGHDAFLVETEAFGGYLQRFLAD